MSPSTHPIGHHTSHTLENGAASCSSGSGGANDAVCHLVGSDQSNVVEVNGQPASTVNLVDLAAALKTPAEYDEGPSRSRADSLSQQSSLAASDDDDVESVGTASTSMCSSGNLANFSIIDTTLREGEQFANAHFTTEDKIKIARALDDFGVEYIEVTSPAASEQSRLDCAALCKLGLRAKILCHIRCNMDDARIAASTGVDGINICIGTSTQLMTNSHGKDLTWIAAKAKEVIAYVQSQGIEVRFSGEDSFRSNFDDIVELYSLMDKLGVQRVGIADTVGGATPMEVYNKITTLRSVVGCGVETHFHNDTGCAVANAFVALEAGATHIDTCVLGIGERNGITPLGSLMAALMPTNRDYILNKYNIKMLGYLDNLIAGIVGVEIPWNNPVLKVD